MSSHFSERTVYLACREFINGESITAIKEKLETEYGIPRLNREHIYRFVRQGVAEGIIRLYPPAHSELEDEVGRLYPNGGRVKILDVPPEHAVDSIAAAGASLVAQIANDLGKDLVRVGIGSGGMTYQFARHLAEELATPRDFSQLVLHALTSGFFPERPLSAPVAFFSLFQNVTHPRMGYVGLFSPAVVPWDEYKTVSQWPGVKESFDLARDIDIVVTSLASNGCEHSLFADLLRLGDATHLREEVATGRRELTKRGWCGDILWRPFSATADLSEVDTGLRPITPFELKDLRRLIQTTDKHVVCLAGPCLHEGCGKTKEFALRPLLREPELRVFNHLVTCRETATNLVRRR